jgi:hypothetical protein
MEFFTVPNIKPERFIFDREGQYHVLKHFSRIDDQYFSELLARGAHSKSDISERMEKFGSKFHENFLSNPTMLIQLLEKKRDFVLNERFCSDRRTELQLIFDMARYPLGIGSDTLVRKNDFMRDSELKIRMRFGFPINHTKGEPIPTWELHLIFTRTDEEWRLITLFPGKYAPPFPDREKQTPTDYEHFSEFWNNHLFLSE